MTKADAKRKPRGVAGGQFDTRTLDKDVRQFCAQSVPLSRRKTALQQERLCLVDDVRWPTNRWRTRSSARRSS